MNRVSNILFNKDQYAKVENGEVNWSEYFTWDGGTSPIDSGTITEVELSNGLKEINVAGDIQWDKLYHHTDVVGYRKAL